MRHALDAIYEKGVFRPLDRQDLAIPEGQRVQLTVDDGAEPEALRLATAVYNGLSEGDIRDIEKIALDRGTFFGRRGED